MISFLLFYFCLSVSISSLNVNYHVLLGSAELIVSIHGVRAKAWLTQY